MVNSVATASSSTSTANTARSDDNAVSFDTSKSRDNTPENRKLLSESYSSQDLQNIQKNAIDSEDYELAATIRDTLKDKTDAVKAKEDEEFKQDLEAQKQAQNVTDGNRVSDLKKQLDEPTETKNDSEVEKRMTEIENQLAEANRKNSELLEELRKAKSSNNEAEFARLRGIIKGLAQDKKNMKDTYASSYKKYDSKKIRTVKTRWVSLKMFPKRTNANGQTVLTLGPQLMFRNNIRSRRRLNKTVKMLNKIKNDPKKGVRYILSKSTTVEGGSIGAGFKKLKYRFTIRDKKKFNEIFEKQSKKFIYDLESKMEKKTMSEADKTTLKGIKARIEWYRVTYLRQMVTV